MTRAENAPVLAVLREWCFGGLRLWPWGCATLTGYPGWLIVLPGGDPLSARSGWWVVWLSGVAVAGFPLPPRRSATLVAFPGPAPYLQ